MIQKNVILSLNFFLDSSTDDIDIDMVKLYKKRLETNLPVE